MHHLTKIKVSSQKKTSPSPHFSFGTTLPHGTQSESPRDTHTHGQTDKNSTSYTTTVTCPHLLLESREPGEGPAILVPLDAEGSVRADPVHLAGQAHRGGHRHVHPVHHVVVSPPDVHCLAQPWNTPVTVRHHSVKWMTAVTWCMLHSSSPQWEWMTAVTWCVLHSSPVGMKDGCYLIMLHSSPVGMKDGCYLIMLHSSPVGMKDGCYLIMLHSSPVGMKDGCYLIMLHSSPVGMKDGCYLIMLHSSPVGMKDGCYLIMLHSSPVGMKDGCYLIMLHSSPVGMKDGCYLIMLHSSSPQWEWMTAVTWCMLHSSPVGMKDGCYLIILHSSSPQDGINYAQFQQAKHAKYYQFGLMMSFDARCG